MLRESMAFSPGSEDEILAQIPAKSAVFLLRGHASSAEPYVSKSSNLKKRLLRLLGAPESASKRLNLREQVGKIEYTVAGSDFESALLLYALLRAEFPNKYRDRLRLNFAPLIKIAWENAYPRAYITRKIGRLKGKAAYYGPFPSRSAAEKFLSGSLDLFKVRRCTFELNPDPSFPGCVYSEMKMCLAPCFRGCGDDAYRAEVARLGEYFDSCGRSLVDALAEERRQLSEELKFEEAAAMHARIEKVRAIANECPEIVHRLDRLRAIILQPSSNAESISIFAFDNGLISGPVQFSVLGMQHPNSAAGSTSLYAHPHLAQPLPDASVVIAGKPSRPLTLEARILDSLANLPRRSAQSSLEWMEHLAILNRWYLRKHKVGEIFFADEKGALPLRRIVRGISRVYRGEREDAAVNFSESSPAGSSA